MCDAKTSESDREAQGERGMDTNECRIYLNTWRQTQESKSNSSQQKGLSGVVWCGEVVWCVASGGEVVAKWMERVMSRDWTARAAYVSSLHYVSDVCPKSKHSQKGFFVCWFHGHDVTFVA